MKATILGCGYVGRAVAIAWEAQGITVTATTTHPERLAELEAIASHAVVMHGNDAPALASLLSDQDIVLISVGAPQRTVEAYEETYLHTAKTLVASLPHTSVQQVIYTGTCAVYGEHEGAWVNEKTAIAPRSRTSEILAATERVLLSAASTQGNSGIQNSETTDSATRDAATRASETNGSETNGSETNVCVLRLGGIYGPGRDLGRIFSRAAGKERPGDGSEPSNWVHLDDIMRAILFAAHYRLNGIFNLVQDHPPSRRDLIDWVCRANQLAPVQWNPDLPGERSYNAKVSNQKIRQTGYVFVHPAFSLE
ncbi:MAG: SDR family oxidoreductase [Elainellaceae cyanobacterium]